MTSTLWKSLKSKHQKSLPIQFGLVLLNALKTPKNQMGFKMLKNSWIQKFI